MGTTTEGCLDWRYLAAMYRATLSVSSTIAYGLGIVQVDRESLPQIIYLILDRNVAVFRIVLT